jgi:hypothetical protein
MNTTETPNPLTPEDADALLAARHAIEDLYDRIGYTTVGEGYLIACCDHAKDALTNLVIAAKVRTKSAVAAELLDRWRPA